MFAILHALGMLVTDLFKPRCRLEAENLFLRHQLAVALRRAPRRLRLRRSDRALLIWMTKLWPSLIGATQVVQPEIILRWHRAGSKVFWRWKSRNRAGRPKIDRGLRDLIQRMSGENRLWGASRIHGELLMLGFEVAQSTVSKYMARPSNPPSQTWKTFLQNHAEAIAAIDMCIVPTLTFDLLFALLVLGHGRRQLLWFEVTRRPTAEWLARQITEAFPWASAPAYLVRDNDRAYGHIFTSRVRAMGIRDRPISPGSPWQNGIAERLIRTVRRECLDYILVSRSCGECSDIPIWKFAPGSAKRCYGQRSSAVMTGGNFTGSKMAPDRRAVDTTCGDSCGLCVLQNHDPRANRDAFEQVDDVMVQKSDATTGNILADSRWLIGPMDAVKRVASVLV
jgi:transposase InsO family protein